MDVDDRSRSKLADRFESFCPSLADLDVPAGYRDSGAALIDSVFSMRAHYTGTQRAVASYAKWAGLKSTPGLPVARGSADRHTVADVHERLKSVPPAEAARQIFNNEARHSGRLKAELVRDAAASLTRAGATRRYDVALLPTDSGYANQKVAWQSVHGLGPVTFEYYRMLCGAESTKPDVMIISWLHDVLGRTYSWRDALDVVVALRDELEVRWAEPVSLRAVDHTIWRHQSGRR